jgi:hypothetical protein
MARETGVKTFAGLVADNCGGPGVTHINVGNAALRSARAASGDAFHRAAKYHGASVTIPPTSMTPAPTARTR